MLKDKVAIVTGGASGIGESIVERFLEEGASVCIFDRKDSGDKKEDRCFFHTDVALQDSVERAIEKVVAKYGRVDILVNNAGIAHIGTVETTTEGDLDRVYEVNVKGIYNCIHCVIPVMKKNGGGSILNMASVAAHVGISERFAYSMTKGAVLSMTYSVAKDYVNEGIRCNSISPARVHTPFVDGYLKNTYPGKEKEMFDALSATQPIGRMGQPVEIADLAAYLCSDKASFITGTDFPIDGGFIKLNS